MPRFDKTGPLGQGSRTGRGLGTCRSGAKKPGMGRARPGRGACNNYEGWSEEELREEEHFLEEKLRLVRNQLAK